MSIFERLSLGTQMTFILTAPPDAYKEGGQFCRVEGDWVHIFHIDEIHRSRDGSVSAIVSHYLGPWPVMKA